jgi:hypothetical protein
MMRFFHRRRMISSMLGLVALVLLTPAQAGDEKPRYILGKAYHVPSEYTNQESGYFSII